MRRLVPLVLERVVDKDLAFLAVSCRFVLASKSPSSSDVIWGSDSQKAGQVMDVVNDVAWINQFPLGMHTSHRAI